MSPISIELIVRLVVAILLGSFIGLERIYAGKVAGIRTYALVALGSALFVVVADYLIHTPLYFHLGDSPLRVISAVITGIGFLGGGLIVFNNKSVQNLTTAAGLWVASGIGIASGLGLYWLAISVTILVLVVFLGLAYIEKAVKIHIQQKKTE